MNIYSMVWANHDAEGKGGKESNEQYALVASCSAFISTVKQEAK